jgi:hypothetical protein
MSEAKYNSVIHVTTNKIVTAFKFENDATWIGKEREELIATANYCLPSQTIKMIFVKAFIRKDGIKIHPYFRASPGQPKLIINLSGESDEHRKAKQNIHDGIYSGEIKINGLSINKNEIEDIYIEYRTSQKGYVIPDVMIKFKKEHIKYGLGIFIEVQLSKQYEDETLNRTYSRVMEGFSGIWIWENDLDEKYNLKNKNLIIKSHKELLSELEKERENNFINRINNYGEIIDKKLVTFKAELWNYFDSSYKSFQIESNHFSKDILEKLSEESNILREQKIVANELNNAISQTDTKKLKNDINKSVKDGLIFLEESFKNKTNELLKKNIDQTINKINRLCPKCNKPMKIGKSMSGYNWYCQDFPLKCDGRIKDVKFNEN